MTARSGRPAARDHRGDLVAAVRRRPTRAAAAPVLAPKYADGQVAHVRTFAEPLRRIDQSLAEQLDVEHVCPVLFLVAVRQVEEKPWRNHARFSARATARFRGLNLLLPLPCAKTTIPAGCVGPVRIPGRRTGPTTTSALVGGSAVGASVRGRRLRDLPGVPPPPPRPRSARSRGRTARCRRSDPGVSSPIASSATARSCSRVSAGATGTARTMRRAPRRRTTSMAARAVKPGCQPVVHQDHGTALDPDGWSIPRYRCTRRATSLSSRATIWSSCSCEMFSVSTSCRVHDPDAAFAYRSEAELWLPGATELAHDEHVERGMKGGRNLRSHGDTAPREAPAPLDPPRRTSKAPLPAALPPRAGRRTS